MALADLTSTGRILVSGKADVLLYVSRIPGAKKADQLANGYTAYTLPATLDSCMALKKLRIPLSKALSDYGNQQWKIQKYVEKVKLQTGKVEPLQPIPIKAPYSLYQHQVKAYNIALALFGRGARKEAEP